MPFLEGSPRQLLARTDAVEALAERSALLAIHDLRARAEIDRAVVPDVGNHHLEEGTPTQPQPEARRSPVR